MPLTNQTLFDTVVIALRKQVLPSKNEEGFCLYRGPHGLKCAVGHLIPDEMYKEEMEDVGAFYLPKKYPEIEELFDDCSMHLIDVLQEIHDCYHPKSWEEEWKKVAQEYDLIMPPLE